MTTETKKIEMIKAHLAINVRNVEQSIEFYKKMFNLEPSKIRTGYAKFDVQNPPLNFTLNQVPYGDSGALSHMGIQVGSTEDVLAVREQWRRQGLITRDEMQTDCCYATQDKTWVHDPDGNEWEVFVVLKDNLSEAPTGSAVCCTSGAVAQHTAVSAKEKTAEKSSCGCATAPAAPVKDAVCLETRDSNI